MLKSRAIPLLRVRRARRHSPSSAFIRAFKHRKMSQGQVHSSSTAQSRMETISTHLSPKQNARFADVPQAPEDAMFGLSAAFRRDNDPKKVDLGVGAYRDNNAQPYVLPVVKKASALLDADPTLNHEYLPIAGQPDFLSASQRLLFGANASVVQQGRVISMQTLSGTGALHLGAKFLSKYSPQTVYVSDPPYVNHRPIMHAAGLETALHPYYDARTKGLDFDCMLGAIEAAPVGSTVLLHACAHNPTGVDPSHEQWERLADAMKQRNHLPFFDSAYQGFASGDADKDAWVVRLFAEKGFDMLVAQSYAKNFGLYGERAGCLHVVVSDPEIAARVQSQLTIIQRVSISTPPAYGARIVWRILNDPEMAGQWRRECAGMAERMQAMRRRLRGELERLGTPGNWEHVTEQVGMFCYSGLDKEQVVRLRERWHVYATPTGRLSVAGLNEGNVRYAARSIDDVLSNR